MHCVYICWRISLHIAKYSILVFYQAEQILAYLSFNLQLSLNLPRLQNAAVWASTGPD